MITLSLQNLMTEAIVSNLHPAYTYICRVSAVTVDVGVSSGNVTLQMEEAGTYICTSLSFPIKPLYSTCAAPSGPPVNIRLTSILARSITLSWNLPLPEDLNGVITGYTVKVENADSGETSLFTTTEAMYIVSALIPYQTYNISVAASTMVGRGPFSASTPVITPEDGKNLYKYTNYDHTKLSIF